MGEALVLAPLQLEKLGTQRYGAQSTELEERRFFLFGGKASYACLFTNVHFGLKLSTWYLQLCTMLTILRWLLNGPYVKGLWQVFFSRFDKFLVNILLATLWKSIALNCWELKPSFCGSQANGAFKCSFHSPKILFCSISSNPLMSLPQHNHFTLSETIENSKIDLFRNILSFRGTLSSQVSNSWNLQGYALISS